MDAAFFVYSFLLVFGASFLVLVAVGWVLWALLQQMPGVSDGWATGSPNEPEVPSLLSRRGERSQDFKLDEVTGCRFCRSVRRFLARRARV